MFKLVLLTLWNLKPKQRDLGTLTYEVFLKFMNFTQKQQQESMKTTAVIQISIIPHLYCCVVRVL